MEQAKLLLTTTDLAATIALQLVFSSQSHLTQYFKQLTGMIPKAESFHFLWTHG
ncbi:helix-turn-helix domain-containing protein [Scytonema millei]|uniref:Helix-turn-helix domain-containing protein n=1 Tax=Scytonema millei VB511283 TaxID=1245923 RepID=A0A9X5E4Z5_9CYAN|nr:helix-turn-helix domain-containing protein [Scytonema millei]NHC35366.1 helix-turn-helix domain-containing protein [Scytonema millei VB511283]